MTSCPTCGHENPPDARFCSACGTILTPDADAREVRKVITVIFTDLVDSTKLGERLDSEALRRLMARYFTAMQATLERHGGTVEKFIGDAIMAAFGIPTLHEDDALRAVRAAVEMRDVLARLNTEFAREHGIRITARTGVNTGQVVAGDVATRETFATGDAVNVAARLEQAAAPGEILLGEDTYRLVRDAVHVEHLEPLALKGKADSVSAWRLLAVLPDLPAFPRAVATAFVGRDQDLHALVTAFEGAVAERTCRVATVVGPPGIGKSRLARELVAELAGRADVVIGRCLPYGEGITYWPLAEIVRQVAGAEPRARLLELLAGDEQAAVISTLLAGAVGAAESSGSLEETAWAFRRLFEALARNRPLLAIIDDIHWAESTLLDLLEYIASFSSGAAITLLCLTRPDLLDSRPTWAVPRPNATLISLAPLTDDETQGMIEQQPSERQVSGPARRRIVDAAEGNPLFIEQMLALHAQDPDAELVVPPTIQALLAARIDRLEPEERAILGRASIEGRLFHREAIAELLPARSRVGMGAQLTGLIRKEFLRPDRALFPGDDAFRFNHILIRDAAYESMPKQLRAQLHERYAGWLERRVNGTAEAYQEILAYHLEQAYRYRAQLGQVDANAASIGSRAGRMLADAGRRASARGDAHAGVRLLERAVSLLETDPRTRTEVLPDYALALRESGDLDAAERIVAEPLAQAHQVNDERSERRAEMERAWVMHYRGPGGWLDEAREAAERAVETFERLADDGELAGAWVLRGIVEHLSGDDGAAIVAYRRARQHARAARDDRREVDIWNEMGGAMLFGRTPVPEVLAFMEEEGAWAREKGFPFLEADASLRGPYLFPMLGRFEEGRAELARAKSVFEDLGAKYNLAESFWAGGQLELLAGDAVAAEREFREALRIHVEMGAMRYSAMVRAHLAHALHAQGRDAEALELIDQARAEGSPGDIRYEVIWRTALAKILAGRGETQEASRLGRDAVAIVAATDRINFHADVLVDFAEVLRAGGEEKDATAALEQAARLYTEKGNALCADRIRDAMAKDRDEGTGRP